jgi:hypothetical protein
VAPVLTVYTLALVVMVLVNDPGGESGVEWLYVIPVATSAGMSLFLSVRRRENPVGTLIGVIGASLVTLGATNFMVPATAERGADLATVLLLIVADGAWIVQFVSAFVLLPLWFPTGSPPSRGWAWVGRVAMVLAGVAFLSFALADEVCVRFDQTGACAEPVAVPWGIEGFAGLEPVLLVAMFMAVPAIVALFIRLRRSTGIERQQLKWFLLAATALALSLISSFDNFGLEQAVNDAISAVTLSALWVAIAVAIVRYRLFEIDRIVSRTVTYLVVVVLLGGVFVGVVTLVSSLLPAESDLAVAASTLAVAALFNPVRRRVQVSIDRRFNRARYDVQKVIDSFAGSSRDRLDPGEVSDGWRDVVAATMQPSAISVWIRS